ncbi:lipocalin family protein [Phragmitibacter flavus]|uniref:Lipocalin family protein n=2 Tax=Phragmitibacter flavus TaxID=2576071 RepID=A0A5R8KHP5_9BACT|nr:lipocalin family protein [Phragmitibacter flavus]
MTMSHCPSPTRRSTSSFLLNSLLASLSLLLLANCTSAMKKSAPPATVDHVDLPRYMGDWYVIAHVPYSLEKGKVGTLDRYAMRPDGKIDNIFLFRKETLDAPLEDWKGVAWVHNKKTNAEWRVQFLWPLRNAYLILDLDKDYQWSAVGLPNRKLVWILSRETTLPDDVYQGIVNRLAEKGYPTSKLAKVPQLP